MKKTMSSSLCHRSSTVVSKAFQVLSDPEKRAAYDRHGADPDSRSAGVPSSSAFGGGGRGGMHFSHEDAIDPDQLFRMFFGGGGFDHPGMQFGGGPTVFQFGGGRTTFRRTGFNRPQQRQHPNEPEVRTASTWLGLLPIVLFFVVSLLQSFPALFTSPSTPDPSFSWNPSTVYPIQRVTLSPDGITCESIHFSVLFQAQPGKSTRKEKKAITYQRALP